MAESANDDAPVPARRGREAGPGGPSTGEVGAAPAASSRNTVVAYLLAALAALCWSGNHIVGRAIVGEVPPFAVGSIRWFGPVLILLPFVAPHLRRDWAEIRRSLGLIVVLSLLGGALFGTLQYVGLQHTTALNVSVLNSVAPVLIIAAGAVLFADRVGWLQALGIVISLAGVIAIISKGRLEALLGLAFNKGDLIILLNMAIFAVYSAMLRRRGKMHWVSFTFVLAVISAIATLPFWCFEHMSGQVLKISSFSLSALAFVTVFPSLVAYAAWSRGVELIGSGRAGVFLHLIPLYSALMAGAFLGERIEAFHLVGFALILSGVGLAARRNS